MTDMCAATLLRRRKRSELANRLACNPNDKSWTQASTLNDVQPMDPHSMPWSYHSAFHTERCKVLQSEAAMSPSRYTPSHSSIVRGVLHGLHSMAIECRTQVSTSHSGTRAIAIAKSFTLFCVSLLKCKLQPAQSSASLLFSRQVKCRSNYIIVMVVKVPLRRFAVYVCCAQHVLVTAGMWHITYRLDILDVFMIGSFTEF